MSRFNFKEIQLPSNYVKVAENVNAILAHSECKKEYVAWTKDANGGVCWGAYFGYDYCTKTTQDKALAHATKAFEKKGEI